MNRLSLPLLFTFVMLQGTLFAQGTASPYYLSIAPSGNPSQPLLVEAGKTVHFAAKAYEALPNTPPREVPCGNLHWTVDPAQFGTISATGDFVANGSSGASLARSGMIIAEAGVGGVFVRASVYAMIGQPTTLNNNCSISGVVTDAKSVPVSGAVVTTMPANSAGLPASSAISDASGRYRIALPPGKWYLKASAAGFLPEYYQNAPDILQATFVQVDTLNKDVTGIDFSLSQGGVVSGSVYALLDNSPISQAIISITGTQGTSPSTAFQYRAISDAAGGYSVGGLPAGMYYVQATAQGYEVSYYLNKHDLISAIPVRVQVDSQTMNIDFHLDKTVIVPPTTYTISGTVKDGNGSPIALATVAAENPVSASPLARRYTTRTANDGSYQLQLPGGPYTVQASAPGFLTEYYDKVRTPDSATLVTVNAATPVRNDIDFRMDRGGVITGRVIASATQSPLEDAFVSIVVSGTAGTPGSSTALAAYQARTDINGIYSISGLGAGNYMVLARKSGFQDQYFDKVSQPQSAAKVVVLENRTTANIDFELSDLPGITGHVVDAISRAPIPGAEVVAEGGGRAVAARADSAGNYRISVPAGSYRVRAVAVKYATEWYNEKSSAQLADNVIVSSGVISGIDFTLDIWNGSISGTVRDTLGNPIANASVQIAMNTVSSSPTVVRYGFSALTRNDGTYTLDGLPPGAYVLSARANGFLIRYFDNVDKPQSASPVSVQSNQAVTGIDFVLQPGASISGKVFDAKTNAAIPYAFVNVRGATGVAAMIGTRTDSAGNYTLSGLSSGDYILFASAYRYTGEYYDNVQDPRLATPVHVSVPAACSGIDFALDQVTGKVKFAGTVSDHATSAVPEYVCIEAVHSQTGSVITTTTNQKGEFEIAADENCVLRAWAIGYAGEYAGQTRHWEESRTPASAAELRFALTPCGESANGIVAGKVLDADTKLGVADVWVYGVDAGGQTYFTTTNGDGTFSLAGPSDGTLTITTSSVAFFSTQNAVSLQGGSSGNVYLQIRRTDATVGVKQPSLPSKLTLAQNYPNPFSSGRPITRISFTIASAAQVRLTVYNLLGDHIATLMNESKATGSYHVDWDAAGFPSGIYLYKLETGGNTITRRMTLLK